MGLLPPSRLLLGTCRLLVLVLSSIFILGGPAQADVHLTFPPYPALFRPDSTFECTGWSEYTVSLDQYCRLSQDGTSFDLTPNSASGANTFNTSARLMYERPVRFYDSSTGRAASFSTFFTFAIQDVVATEQLGSGMTFLIAPNVTTPGRSIGGDLGLFDSNTGTGEPNDGRPSRIVAVEFDTYQRGAFDTVEAPHVGLDINSLRSVNATYLWNETALAKQTVAVWIDYAAATQYLEVRLMNITPGAAVTREQGVVWLTYSGLNLSSHVNEYSYVGFSAASASNVDRRGELHTVYNWTFSSTGVNEGTENGGVSLALVIGLVVGLTVPLVFALAGVVFFVRRSSRKKKKGKASTPKRNSELSATGLESLGFSGLDGPREFSFNELKVATSNFSDHSVLGEGGFGKVHRGVLPDKSLVAVKRVAEQSRQGEREFLAEVTTIGRLRHKNLVPLKGWCKNQDELLLVYEYMPNGSLFDHLFRSTHSSDDDEAQAEMKVPLAVFGDANVLSWDHRYRIIQGVASALHYLHSEWEEQTLIHRDVKSSNVMLDANWNARLGDFGLARVVKKNKSAATVTNAAGTRGYLAPESMYSDKVSAESDVFSFGVLSLEVASGRKPIEWLRPPEEKFLVNWVWSLNQEGRLLEAADPQLAGKYDAKQMITALRVGMLCCVQEPTQRPSMRQVMHYLISCNVDDTCLHQSPLDYNMGAISNYSSGSSGATSIARQGLQGVSGFSQTGSSSSFTGETRASQGSYGPTALP